MVSKKEMQKRGSYNLNLSKGYLKANSSKTLAKVKR